jgi:hypothetical protein
MYLPFHHQQAGFGALTTTVEKCRSLAQLGRGQVPWSKKAFHGFGWAAIKFLVPGRQRKDMEGSGYFFLPSVRLPRHRIAP